MYAMLCVCVRKREKQWRNTMELSYESQSLPVSPTNSNIPHYACHLSIYTYKVRPGEYIRESIEERSTFWANVP